jgi:hypothetical protein
MTQNASPKNLQRRQNRKSKWASSKKEELYTIDNRTVQSV